MSNFNSTSNLHSVSISKALKLILGIRLTIAIASGLLSLIYLITKSLTPIFASTDVFIFWANNLVNFSSTIVFCIWLYCIHFDLTNIFGEYSIRPGGSIARFLVPIYSFWVIANIFNTFANKFEQERGDLSKFGETVRSLIVPFYVFLITSNLINPVAIQYNFINLENPSVTTIIYLISAILDAVLSFVFLSLTKAMQNAVNQKAKRTVG